MLLVQEISLSWGKRERGSAYARARAEFPAACSLDKLPEAFHGDVIVHHLDFMQKETMFQPLPRSDGYRLQIFSSVQDLNLTNLSVQADMEGYEVTFFYDARRSGRPARRGHNKDYRNMDSPLYRHDVVNETAFSLGRGQYGRVIWNERKIDCDTGEWYYQWHVVNLVHCLDKIWKADIFLTGRPDYEYRQVAALR